MAKTEEKVTKTAREELWEKYLEMYKAKNPVKFAQKQANKEFDKIPDSFVGKVSVVRGKEFIY